MNHTTGPLSKKARKRVADYRKGVFAERGLVFKDLARLADLSFSMVDKWMNGYRTSDPCAKAFETLTRMPAFPEERAA